MINLEVKQSISLPGYFHVRAIIGNTCVNLGNVTPEDLAAGLDDLSLDLTDALKLLDGE